MLVAIILWRHASVPLEITAEEKRVVVADLLRNLFDWVVAFEQAPARVIDSFATQPVNRGRAGRLFEFSVKVRLT